MSEGRAAIVRLLEGVTAFFLLLEAVIRPLASGDLLGLGDTIYVSLPLWFALVFWLLRTAAVGRLRLHGAGGDVLLLALVLLVVVSPRLPVDFDPKKAPELGTTLRATMAWATNLLCLYLVVNVGREARFARWVLAALLSTAFAIAVYGWVQATVDLPRMQRDIEKDPSVLSVGQDPEAVEELRYRAESARPYASFLNENALAGFLALLLLPLLGVLLETDRASWRFGARAAIALAMFALFAFCRSKGASIAFLVGLYAFLWAGRAWLWSRAWFRWGTAALILLLIVVLVALSAWTAVDPLHVHVKDSSAWVRLGYWQGAVRVFLAHPWTGVGLDAFHDHYYEVKAAEAGEVNAAHDDWLQVAAELGVVGILAFAGFWLLTVVRGLRATSDPPDTPPEGPVFLRSMTLTIGCVAAALLGPFLLEGRLVDVFLPCLGDEGYSALLLSVAWILAFVAFRPSPRQASSRWVRAGLTGGLCAALAHAAVDLPFYVHGYAFAIWAVAGVAITFRSESRAETPILDLELGAIGKVCAVLMAGAFVAVLVGAIVPVMRRAQEEEEILRAARNTEGRHPDYYKAMELAPWDPRPKVYEADFRHSACRQISREALERESGGIGKPLTSEAVRHLYDLRRSCVPALEDAIRFAPRDRSLRYRLGRFHEEHADKARDVAAKEEGPQRDALVSLEQAELGEALTAYEASYRLYPTRPENAWRMGRMLERLGRTEEAEPYLRRALELHRLQTLRRLKLPQGAADDLERRFGGHR